jgi:probable phosphoglycerate mutase
MNATQNTLIHFVRHGATELTIDDRFAGSGIDVALSTQGRFQARCLAERLAETPLRAVIASPLQRAWSTAQTVSHRHGLAPSIEPDLREISFGRWEGLSRDEIVSRYGDEFDRWRVDPYRVAPEGGETGEAALARALPVLQRLLASHAGQEVLVVSHKCTIRLLLSVVLGIDTREYRTRLEHDPAALTTIAFYPDRAPEVVTYNDRHHYDVGTLLAA